MPEQEPQSRMGDVSLRLISEQNSELREQLESALKRIALFERTSVYQTEENQRLHGELEKSAKELEKAGKAVLEFRHRYQQAKAETQRYQEALSDVHRNNEDEALELRQKNNELREDVAQFRTALKRFLRYKNRINKYVRPLLDQVKNGSYQSSLMVSELQEARFNSIEMKKEITLLKQHRDQLRNQILEERAKIKAHAHTLQEKVRLQNQKDQDEILRYKRLLSEASTNQQVLDARNRALNEDIKTLGEREEAVRTDLVKTMNERRQLEASVKVFKQEINTLRARSNEEIAELRERDGHLNRQNRRFEKENRFLRRHFGKIRALAHRFRDAVKAEQNETIRLKTELNDRIEAVKALQVKILIFEENIAQTEKSHRNNSQKQTIYYEQRVEALKEELEKTINDLESTRSETSKFRDQLNRLEPETKVLKARAQNAERDREGLKVRYAEELDRYANIVMKLRTRSFARGNEITRLKNEIAHSEKTIGDLNDRIKELENELQGIHTLWEASL